MGIVRVAVVSRMDRKTKRNEHMSILKNFDIDSIRKARARKNATGGVDLEAGLRQLSPDIEKLKVGETAQIEIPNDTGLRKFVMSITAKLNNLTPKNGKWEGRQFRVVSDSEKYVYVQRAEDLKGAAIVERKRGGGGRPKGSGKAAANTNAGAAGGEPERVRA